MYRPVYSQISGVLTAESHSLFPPNQLPAGECRVRDGYQTPVLNRPWGNIIRVECQQAHILLVFLTELKKWKK